MEQAALMGGATQEAAPVAGERLRCPPVAMFSDVVILVEVWAPPQDWRKVEVMPKAVVVALHKIGESLEKQCLNGVRAMYWLFLTMLKKTINEKDMIL